MTTPLKRITMAALVAPLAVLMVAGFATAAAAQETLIEFSVFFCPDGSTVTMVIDGETTDDGPFIADASDSVNAASVTVPDGVPGNVLVAVCSGAGTVATPISVPPSGTFCLNSEDSNVTNYTPPPGQLLCLKVISITELGVSDLTAGDGGDISRLVADGANSQLFFGDLFANRPAYVPSPPTRSVGLSTTSPLTLLRAAAAVAAAGGLAVFGMRRRAAAT